MPKGTITKFNSSVLQLAHTFHHHGLPLKTITGEFHEYKCGMISEEFKPLLNLVSGMRQCLNQKQDFLQAQGLSDEHPLMSVCIDHLVVVLFEKEMFVAVYLEDFPQLKTYHKVTLV